MNWRTNAMWASIMVLLAALVAGALLVSFWETEKASDRAQALAAAEKHIAVLATLLSVMQDAETGQRGYVITGLDEYLEPYEAARQRMGNALAALDDQYASRPETRLEVAHIRVLAEQKMARVTFTVGVRRARGFEAARDVILDHVGKHTMDELRREIAFLTAIERTHMARAERDYETAQSRSRGAFAALSATILLGLGTLLVVAAREMRASYKANTRLGYLADHDPLTGLANRRAFHMALDRNIGASAAGGQRFGLFCLDLDGFKGINDRFGHEAGDRLLVEVTKRLRAITRGSDVLARLGGDEFALLVPDLPSEAECHEVVGRLKQAIASVETCDPCRPVSGSVGFALFPNHASSKADLLALSDKRMYLDKRRTTALRIAPDLGHPEPQPLHEVEDLLLRTG
ncbi:diguanylate cyclase domain-containing protein [Rubellimicrobium rubrum]|uniref:diguanylate cyclase domain-containing protein n=1 Tax=Rubellimicrobium rubrum TaxID=2585369 RepID=UPI00159B981F|nr:diguanylate cyclase [Rubellimicrobium rubrum]